MPLQEENRYRHRQIGFVTLFGVGGTAAVLALIALLAGLPRDVALVLSGVAAILAICAGLFSSLTVQVSNEELCWWFGPGLIRLRCPVSQIEDVRKVTNKWYYGWGIKITPHGWLYNVSGLAAVEIVQRSGVRFRIGTDEPDELHDAVLALLSRRGGERRWSCNAASRRSLW